MPTINKEIGSITYDNTAIKMQERIEGDDLYSPLYPRELASNVNWNKNTLTLPNETGNSTYETKYRALDYTYAEQYLFALKDCIYKYVPDTKTLNRIYYFYQELEDDYFVDISTRTGENNSDFYFITNQGKIYSFPANNWYDTHLQECTGIVYINGKMLITTKHGLYMSDWDNTQSFNFTQIQVSDFNINTPFSVIDIMVYQGQQQVLIITSNHTTLGAISSLTNPTSFTKVAEDVSNTYHQYKNIIPQLNLVICTDGIWNVFDSSTSYFNSSDLRNLKDTQYIYYIKKWSSSHYECSNNKWNMTVGYNGSGNIISSASYSDGSPMYVLFPDSDVNWCLTINNNGKAYHTVENSTSVYSTSCGNISLVTYRAPRYNYHVDIGDGSQSTQDIMQSLNDSMVQDGRMFDEISNVPFTFANYNNRYYLTSEPIITEDKSMQCLYNVQSMEAYIFKDNKWMHTNIFEKISAFKLCYSLYSNCCWYNNELWGIFGVPNSSIPYIFKYNPVTDNLTYYNTNISVTNASPLAGWSITVNSDNIVFSTGWLYSDGDDDADSVTNYGIYSTPYTTNLNTASWTKVQLSSNLNEYTAVSNLQTIKINGENIIYAVSVTGYDGDVGRVSRLISNTLMSTCSSDVLGKFSYQYIPVIKVGKLKGNDIALIPESRAVYYTSDFTNVLKKDLDNDMSCPKVEYLSEHNRWIIYEGSTDELEQNLIQYQYMLLNSEDLALQGDLSVISLTAFAVANSMMCSSMTPWVYEQDGTYINICLPNGIIGYYTISNNKLTFSTLEQTYINLNDITLQKMIKGADKYILLYSFTPYNVFDKMPKSSCICYSDDGIHWYGGYNFDGYYNDMCYGNGQLWLGGWSGIDNNSTFVPTILYSGDLAAGSVDMINYGQNNSTDANLSIDSITTITNLQSSIATSGNTVCMINTYNATSALTYIQLVVNEDTMTSGAIVNLQGYCTKIVAGTNNSYFYVLNTTSQRILQELTMDEISTTRTTRGTYDVLAGMEGQVSEYDPVHDGIYITCNTGADIYTQSKLFHIGSINNTAYANQVGWFHGRYLYNIRVGSATKSAYGIVPWFNSYPHDCKYLPMVIKKLCTCGDKCFIISDDNKLYISSAI